MPNIHLVAETGCDLTPQLAEKYGVTILPMHVTMYDKVLDDGTFPAEDIAEYYDKTGKVPTTSACSPYEFEQVFQAIHEKDPQGQILHLSYSAATTSTFHNALIAGKDRPYVMSLDTKQATLSYGLVVIETALYLEKNPQAALEEAAAFAREMAERAHLCFIPNNLDYLRAGGRVSNKLALVGNILNLHPLIEMADGKLMASKKYRGRLEKIARKVISEFTERYDLDRGHVYLIYSTGLEDGVRIQLEEGAKALGFQSFTWMKVGCVITCHGGTKAFGVVGVSRKKD